MFSARCRRFAWSIMDALMRAVLVAWFLTAAAVLASLVLAVLVAP